MLSLCSCGFHCDSRPHVSDDSPYSESQFKTLKYRPGFPDRFGSIQDGRSFCQDFFPWYNCEHRHSGIGLLTPEMVHYGKAEAVTSQRQIVLFANNRCNQENVIGQLKSGVNALRMPSDGLISNWAYMVIAALAWNLKAWYGLVTLEPAARRDILRIEFKRFLGSFVQIPCQIVATGRRLVYRILTYSQHLETFLATFDHIRELKFT
jgi:hypothetical protein